MPSRSFRLYRLLVRLYPCEFRQRHGEELIENFRDLERDGNSALELWVLVGPDFLFSLKETHMANRSSQAALLALLTCLPFLALVCMAAMRSFGWDGLNPVMHDLLAAHRDLAVLVIFRVPMLGLAAVLLAAALDLRRAGSCNPLRGGFLAAHLGSLAMAGLALGVLLFPSLHDAVPCALRAALHAGLAHGGAIPRACVANG